MTSSNKNLKNLYDHNDNRLKVELEALIAKEGKPINEALNIGIRALFSKYGKNVQDYL